MNNIRGRVLIKVRDDSRNKIWEKVPPRIWYTLRRVVGGEMLGLISHNVISKIMEGKR